MNSFPQRCRYFFYFLFLLSITDKVVAQSEKEHTDLLVSIATAEDKPARAVRLAEMTEKVYTPSNMMYFSSMYQAALHSVEVDPRRAVTYIDKAINAFLAHTGAYAQMDANSLVEGYKVLCAAYNAVGLTSTAIQRLDAVRNHVQTLSKAAKCNYYNLLGEQYLILSRFDKAAEAFREQKQLMDNGAPMVTSAKSDPKWKRDFNARMEAIYQDMAKFYYSYSMGRLHFKQQNYEEAIPHMKDYIALNAKFNQQIADDSKISRFARMLVADSMKVMIDENKRYQEIRKQIGGEKLDLITALVKTGRAEDAVQYTGTLQEKAHYHHLMNAVEESEKAYKEIYDIIDDFSNWRYYRWTATAWKNQTDPAYLRLQAFRKNFSYAYPKFREQLEARDESLEEDFAYFSENEKKEYFQDYANKLGQYYSLLLLMAETDPSKHLEILNKSLQTKGLIMEATQQQETRFSQVREASVMADVERIKTYREKLLAFAQVSATNAVPLMEDSLLHYNLAVNNLQKSVNEKIGVPKTILQDVSWKDIQGRLKPKEAYVEVLRILRENFAFDKPVPQYWAFVVKPHMPPVTVMLGEGESFEKGLAAYQNTIRFQLEDENGYAKFWQKLSEALAGHDKVYLSGDGIYHLINPLVFKNPATGKYLVDEIQLIRVSTGRDVLKSSHALKNESAVLIGNPDFTMNRKSGPKKTKARPVQASMVAETRGGFGVLPGAEKEVLAIASHAGSNNENVITLTGSEATESKVKSVSHPGVLHFATHGVFDNYSSADSYLRSKLILAGADDPEPFNLEDYAQYEDGYLTAFEVTQMNLSNTRLVVLSACETGLGEIQSGEGVWGLQRAFQVAGARNVLGSLWKISDDATAVFMDAFYKSYYNGSAIRTAYTDAMKATRTKYPHPYFWGAFVLVGAD